MRQKAENTRERREKKSSGIQVRRALRRDSSSHEGNSGNPGPGGNSQSPSAFTPPVNNAKRGNNNHSTNHTSTNTDNSTLPPNISTNIVPQFVENTAPQFVDNSYYVDSFHLANTSASSQSSDITRKKNLQALLGMLKFKEPTIPPTGNKTRIQKSEFQKAVLRDVFRLTKFPTRQTREDLAMLLCHTARGIQIWFQNQRNKCGLRDASRVYGTPNDNILNENGTINTNLTASVPMNNLPEEDEYVDTSNKKQSLLGKKTHPSDKKKTIDIATLSNIVERHIPNDDRGFWESFINYEPTDRFVRDNY